MEYETSNNEDRYEEQYNNPYPMRRYFYRYPYYPFRRMPRFPRRGFRRRRPRYRFPGYGPYFPYRRY